MPAHKTLRWGIVGVGRFGQIHGRAIQGLPGSELVAVCNRNAERLERVATSLGVDRRYTDFHRLVGDPAVDIVAITTHWRDHFEPAHAALASGKHVFLEKPMAASSDECHSLVELAEESAGHFMVGHICRFDPRVTVARDAVLAGRIGRIVSMHAKRNLPQAPGHIRLDKIPPLIGDGIHDADLMMWFLGRSPRRVYARHVRWNQFAFPDLGWALLEFGDDAIGVIETNWGLPTNVATTIDACLEIVGTEGMLSIDCSRGGVTVLDASGYHLPDTVYWPQQEGRIVGALVSELQYFSDCVRNDVSPQIITPAEAARAVAVMEAAERSAERGAPEDIRV
jgi:predicted dehydrogenase